MDAPYVGEDAMTMQFEYMDEQGEVCYSLQYNQVHLNAEGSKPASGEIRISRSYLRRAVAEMSAPRYVFLPTFIRTA